MTGAIGSIAEHVVRTLHRAGATLILTDRRSPDEAHEVLSQWSVAGNRTHNLQLDVVQPAEVTRAVGEALSLFPTLDCVLGHAGGCNLHPFGMTSQEEFDRIFAFNYLAQTYLARAVLHEWTSCGTAGHLLFTSSYVARVPLASVDQR